MYEGQRKRNNVVDNEMELSNEEKEILIESVNEETESDSRHEKVRPDSIDIVEYVSTTMSTISNIQ